MSLAHSTPPMDHARQRTCGVRGRARSVLLLGLTVLALAAPARAEAPDGNAIKADMLCNMAKFVQWPEGVIAQNRGQLVVSILGEDELAATIANVLSSRSVNGKPVFVRFARRVQDLKGSQIVYIAASESAHFDEITTALRGTPMLTLSDSDGFAQHGGMMNFTGTPPRVRFEISLARAEQAGLRISSRLLAIARVVDGTP